MEDLSNIFEVVYSAKWYDLGIMLKVKIETLDHLHREESRDPNYCLSKVLHDWLTSSTTKTMRALAEALGSGVVGRPDLKQKILGGT